MIDKFNLLLSSSDYKISRKLATILLFLPIVLTFIMALLIVLPSFRSLYFWLLEENNPVELLTFLLFFVGGCYGVYSSLNIFKSVKKYVFGFYIFFSICLIILAMEEVAWGQWFFFFETPEEWKKINYQGETTLHNIGALQFYNDNLRLIFGISGLIGIFLRRFSSFRAIGVPTILILWFIIITFQSVLDVIVDLAQINNKYGYIVEKSSEFIEMLIAGSAFLYLWLNYRLLKITTTTL
ncbi:hypothetical protein [Wocania ichthyoenteri]|uniref:hypothetical protein n=1 Tax=Wocania ichthyoenteri TaxID=1230531 RepID=UPI00053D4C3D|nr:hypothetical protein [Wocania ichthyoenteri]